MRLKQLIPIRARFERKLADMWIGVFWRKGVDRCSHWDEKNNRPVCLAPERLDIWICLVPCFPLHVKFGGNERRQPLFKFGDPYPNSYRDQVKW
jgi:hypothetical protein